MPSITKRPKPPGNRVGYAIPLPIDDPSDVFKIGVAYQRRWFTGEVIMPTGVLSWVDSGFLRPYAEKLAHACSTLPRPVTLRIQSRRYILDGLQHRTPPTRTMLPSCKPISLATLIKQMDGRIEPGTEEDVVRWIEYIIFHAPDLAKPEIKKACRITDLLR